MPTPPNLDPISQLYLSDTFYTWYKKTNDLVTKVNPIEVYSVAGNTQDADLLGITMSDDSLGNWTIGYLLPAIIPNGHTFSGHIHFGNGVSGQLVNTYNGNTGAVIGVSSIDGLAGTIGGVSTTPDGNGNVQSIPILINGTTASTGGSMTLDASDIPNTISSITGPAGYIITSSGPTMNWTAKLFLDGAGVSGGQSACLFDAANKQVVIAGTTVDVGGAKLKIVGGDHGSIVLQGNAAEANDIEFENQGTIKSDNSINIGVGQTESITFFSGPDGETADGPNAQHLLNIKASPHASATGGVLDITSFPTKSAIRTGTSMNQGVGPHDLAMDDRGSIHGDNGIYFSSPTPSTGSNLNDEMSSLFHFGHGNTFGDAKTVFAIGSEGQIGLRKSELGAIDYGSSTEVLTSGGDGNRAYWSEVTTGGGGGDSEIVPITQEVYYEHNMSTQTLVTHYGPNWQGATENVVVDFSIPTYDVPTGAKRVIVEVTAVQTLNDSESNDVNPSFKLKVRYSPGTTWDENKQHNPLFQYINEDHDVDLHTTKSVEHCELPIKDDSGYFKIETDAYHVSGSNINSCGHAVSLRVVGYVIDETVQASAVAPMYNKVVDWTVEAGPMVDFYGDPTYNTNGSTAEPNYNNSAGAAVLMSWTNQHYPKYFYAYVRKRGDVDWIQVNKSGGNYANTAHDIHRNCDITIIPAGHEWYAAGHHTWLSCTYSTGTSPLGSNFTDIKDHTAYSGAFESTWVGGQNGNTHWNNNDVPGANKNTSDGTAFVMVTLANITNSNVGSYAEISPNGVNWFKATGWASSATTYDEITQWYWQNFLVPSGWYYKTLQSPAGGVWEATVMW